MFDFLKDLEEVQLTPNETKEKTAKTTTSRPRVEKNPTNGADIRIFASGKVYPSVNFAEEFGLEYTDKGSNTISNGLDFFDSSRWANYPSNGPRLLLAYVTRENQPKVELFASTRYSEEGKPINSVLEQGSPISPESLEVIATSLGSVESDGGSTSAWENLLVQLGTEEEPARYVDLYLVREVPSNKLVMPDGIYNIPKQVLRGADKGSWTYQRREKVKVLPLVLFNEEVAEVISANGEAKGDLVEVPEEQQQEVTSQVEETEEVQ